MKPLPVRKECNVGEYVAPHSARSFVRSAAPPGRSEMVSVNCVRRPSAAMPRCSTRPRHVISMLPPLTTATTRFRRPLASGLYTSNQTQLLCSYNQLEARFRTVTRCRCVLEIVVEFAGEDRGEGGGPGALDDGLLALEQPKDRQSDELLAHHYRGVHQWRGGRKRVAANEWNGQTYEQITVKELLSSRQVEPSHIARACTVK